MKYTGIVRRLDSLGRIVIPREYRKMHKIKESDPLEIIAMDNGEIIIKKVDLSAELIGESVSVIDALHETLSFSVMVSDNEKFLLGVGNMKGALSEKPIGSKLSNLIASRKSFNGACADMGIEGGYVCACPVFKEDVFGALYIFSDYQISASDETLLKTLSKVLGANMQKY